MIFSSRFFFFFLKKSDSHHIFSLILFRRELQNVCPSVFWGFFFFRKGILLCQSILELEERKGWRGTGFPYFGCITEIFPYGMIQLLGCVAVLNGI